MSPTLELNTVDELSTGSLEPVSAADVVSWIDLSTTASTTVSTTTALADVVVAATAAARASHRILIGVGWPGAGVADELLDALTVTVHDDPAGAHDRRTVLAAHLYTDLDTDLDTALARMAASIAATPMAAAVTSQLLRATRSLPVHEALIAESFAYSTLQAGPEYARWLAAANYRPTAEHGEPVQLRRDGDRLVITLNRPHRHNALDAAMRDGLVDALTVATMDATITDVLLCGNGASFSSGGDLAEFGTASDPATAHLIRTQHRPGEQIHALATRLGDRCTASVHGAVMGGGLELAAFAARVVAAPDSKFLLPELSMGLLPGAGGTVSVPRRIGRWRAASMILGGNIIDATTALDWGLVDSVEPNNRRI
ncbi:MULTISPECIES: enoyl-CoA hydratase/isomerase family protein [Nocardiaceae]|uniref:Enoyl-CoA hydratase/isomerase family protein n=1 Tax=Rhodococcus cercidiphylli TaxID=489916 RepID=A0ABU4AWH6_9NOCA|nr:MULTISPECIES: enoyl-CoA hydratase/isomerase family protein [Rhodococcus]MDV6230584.1 enoyl-CoA hydratase/isomerase family protein [Rhodococcus cercidiphylli]